MYIEERVKLPNVLSISLQEYGFFFYCPQSHFCVARCFVRLGFFQISIPYLR